MEMRESIAGMVIDYLECGMTVDMLGKRWKLSKTGHLAAYDADTKSYVEEKMQMNDFIRACETISAQYRLEIKEAIGKLVPREEKEL